MGLRNTLFTRIGNAFDTSLADAVQPFTLVRGRFDYDPNTGNLISGGTESGTWRGVFGRANKRYVQDEATLPLETQVICLAQEAPFVPDVNDTIIIQIDITDFKGPTNCYLIERTDIDPTFTVYTLFCKSATHGPVQSQDFS